MNAIVNFFEATFSNGRALLLTSMLPLIELKGAIPIGLAMGFGKVETLLISYLGSTLPALFILPFIIKIFSWMEKRPKSARLVARAKNKAQSKDEQVRKYQYLGLFIFVAIPLPGTGVWMGSLIASLMGLEKKKSFLMIALGNAVAGLIIFLFSNIFIK